MPRVAIACCLGVMLLASTSRAQPAPATQPAGDSVGQELRTEAQRHLDRGRRLFDDGDFVAAAVEFSQAAEQLATIARGPDGTVIDQDADRRRRRALTYAATAYAQADMPVESLDTFVQLRTEYASQMTPTEQADVDDAIRRMKERIGQLEVAGLPDGADVRLDNRAAPKELGHVQIRVAAGPHTLDVTVPDKKPFTTSFTVVPGAVAHIDVKLAPLDAPARVRIEVSVEPAEVWIDGAKKGQAPLEFDSDAGTHKYEVRSESYQTQEGEYTTRAGGSTMVHVAMAPERSPIGLSIEPYFGMQVVNRDDTPLDRISIATGLRLYHQTLRFAGIQFGIQFEAQTREIDRYSFGPILNWCPDRFSWSGGEGQTKKKKARGRWCPLALSTLKTIGGEVGPFTGGENDLRLGTGVEMDFGVLFFRFAGGVGLAEYKRNVLNKLVAGISFFEFSVGMNL
jgi:hypothetical protein